ncbi:hypothetical protein [Serratia sp. 1D1416]|uniref:ParE family toxin-like protein n=1 Tax=Serratia sp. 1D1416 TaxID=2447890 RepID=UPI000FE274F3|nr:hypothetical protein [Serratia sp. 1D1416]
MSIKFNNAPLWITAKALDKLNQLRLGRLFPKKTYGKKYLTLRVNKHWRLLSKDGGNNWQLLTHNDYNSEIDK